MCKITQGSYVQKIAAVVLKTHKKWNCLLSCWPAKKKNDVNNNQNSQNMNKTSHTGASCLRGDSVNGDQSLAASLGLHGNRSVSRAPLRKPRSLSSGSPAPADPQSPATLLTGRFAATRAERGGDRRCEEGTSWKPWVTSTQGGCNLTSNTARAESLDPAEEWVSHILYSLWLVIGNFIIFFLLQVCGSGEHLARVLLKFWFCFIMVLLL